MDRKIIVDKFSDILVRELNVYRRDFTEDSDLVYDLGADSLDIAEIIMCVEDVFHIEIDNEVKETLRTVKEYVDFIEMKLG